MYVQYTSRVYCDYTCRFPIRGSQRNIQDPLLSRTFDEVFFTKIADSFQLLPILASLAWSYIHLIKTSPQTFSLAVFKMVFITASPNRNSYIDLFLKLFMSLKLDACHMAAREAGCSYDTGGCERSQNHVLVIDSLIQKTKFAFFFLAGILDKIVLFGLF